MTLRRTCLGCTLLSFVVGLGLVAFGPAARADAVGAHVATAAASAQKKTTGGSLTALEQSVFERINAIRTERGLPQVSLAEDLLLVARQHSLDQARRNVLTHSSADGKSAGARLDAAGILWLRYGENVALVKGYTDPANTVVEAWMRSPGHAANILDAKLVESAVGVAQAADGTYFLTQIFVTR